MTAADIIALVENHPQGLTTAQAAAATGMKPGTIATRLSKLADYGKIKRERFHRDHATWMPKANGVAP